MTELKKVIMRQCGYDSDEADSQIAEAKEVMQSYLEEDDFESAYNICQEYFNLEPDYLTDLL